MRPPAAERERHERSAVEGLVEPDRPLWACRLLIGSFLWRVLTSAHEYPGRTATYLDIAVDLLVLVGLIAIRAAVPKALFWIALIAGIGLFAIRLNGTASWWTGHLVYTLQ